MCVCKQITFATHLKPMQYCKSTILQDKIETNKKIQSSKYFSVLVISKAMLHPGLFD